MLVAPAQAQQSPPQLLLADFLSLVEQANPELRVAARQQSIAEAERLVAGAYPNPELQLNYGSWRSSVGAAPGTSYLVGIGQPIETPAVREARAAAAGHGVSAALANRQSVRLAIGYQARQSFVELLRRQEDERLARENLKLLEQILGRVLARVQVGEAPRLELVRAESEALAARNAAASASLRVEESRAALRRLAANALPEQFEVQGALGEVPAMPGLAVLQSRVLDAHPALRAAESERARAQARIEHERALRVPQPRLRLGESRDPETRQIIVGVELPLPVWSRREGEIAQAQAVADLTTAQLDLQRTQLLRELDSANARLALAQRQIETFEAGLLRSAENALEVAEAAYRFGERGFIEVLDAQRVLRSVRSDYNQARFERQLAWLDIERLTAGDPFREVASAPR